MNGECCEALVVFVCVWLGLVNGELSCLCGHRSLSSLSAVLHHPYAVKMVSEMMVNVLSIFFLSFFL